MVDKDADAVLGEVETAILMVGTPGVVLFALLAPAKTPPALVAQLNNTLNEAIREASFKKTLADLGAESMAGTPAAADEFIRQEITRWGGIIRSANISID